MKHDLFLNTKAVHTPDEIVKHEWVTKIGWTDEARAAAAEARNRHGIDLSNQKTKPSFTKNQLNHIAHTISNTHGAGIEADAAGNTWADTTRADVAHHFARSLSESNPKFDHGKFHDAATGVKRVPAHTIGPANFSRAHYEHMARTINGLPEPDRSNYARSFGHELQGTNPHYDRQRFQDAAMGLGSKTPGRLGRPTSKSESEFDFSYIDAALNLVKPTSKAAGEDYDVAGEHVLEGPGFLSEDAPISIGGVEVPHTAAAKPAGPRVLELDGDQDGATVKESADPTDTFRPMSVMSDDETGDAILTAEDRWFPNKVDLRNATQKI